MPDRTGSTVRGGTALVIAVAICVQPACSPSAETGRLTFTLRCERAADGFARLVPTVHNGTDRVVPLLVGQIDPSGEVRLPSSLVLRIYRSELSPFDEYRLSPR